MDTARRSGVFLHIASLPGPDGVGTLGAPARRFVDFLSRAGQSCWQFCPTGPTAPTYGNSPYSAYSAFAGNPLFVDLADLRERGLLTEADLTDRPAFDTERVDYRRAGEWTESRLRLAHERFLAADAAGGPDREGYESFRAAEADWLDDYALFMALKEHHGGATWTEWPAPVRDRDPEALADRREALAEEVSFRRFCQYCYDRQWAALRAHADDNGVGLVGDVPIYVGHDSADVWANRDVFQLDEAGAPTVVAGVPDAPDEPFDAQRWGLPVYDWDHLESTGFDWWLRRFDRLFDQVDLVRIDHFRGLESYWAIPADEPDPNVGEWRDVPSEAFFDALTAAFDDLPAFAEDIGHLTDAVEDLRVRYDLPSLKLLPFADWCDADHPHLPHRYPADTVAYTSTHDSDTAAGTHASLDAADRECFERYFAAGPGADLLDGTGRDPTGEDVHWTYVEAAWASDAVLVLAQLQDVLGLGSEARFNVPGTTEGNWSWRVRADQLTAAVADELAAVTRRHGR